MSVDGGLVLAETSEVKDDKERKHFNIETIMDEFLAFETMKTVWMGLAMIMFMLLDKLLNSL